MIERMIFQILGILIVGDVISTNLIFREEYHSQLVRRMINATVCGYFSLIVPMTIVGIFFTGYLDIFVMFYYGLSMALTIIKGIQFVVNRYQIPELNLSTLEKYLVFLNVIIIVGYGFLFYIIPERGWDSMNFYFPNAIYFFAEDGILPNLNPLTFYPTFKPPLNTLYLTYSLYVGQGMFANFHPYVFVIAIACTSYQLTFDLTENKVTALLASVIFLTFQFTTLLVVEFAYYQELPILLFSFASLYYLQSYSTHQDTGSLLGITLALCLSILSKMSGYAVIFMILVAIDVDGIYKRLQVLGLIGITIFFVRKAIIDIYIGTGFVVILVSLLLFYIIIKYESINYNYFDIMKFLVLPVLVGIGWLLFMIQVPGIQNFLQDTYLRTDNFINWTYPAAQIPDEVLIEHGPRASFLGSTFFILIGSAFGPQLLLFKLHGFVKSLEYSQLNRWFLSYLLLFYTYFSDVSARYLVPLMGPLAIMVALSLYTLISRFQESEVKKLIINSQIGLGLLFIIPIVPIRVLRDGFLSFFYLFHYEIIATTAFLLLIIIVESRILLKLEKINIHRLKIINRTVLVFIIIPLVIAPVGVVTYAEVTDTNVNHLSSYYYRPTFQNMISHLQTQELDLDDMIISAITPGLAYFMRQTVLDIHLTSGFRAFSEDLKAMTAQEAIDFVNQYGAKVVIQITEGSLSYSYYQEYYSDVELMEVVNYLDFEQTYQNSEFTVFIR